MPTSEGIASELNQSQRRLLVNSKVLDFAATGNFQLTRLIKDITAFVQEDIMSFKSNVAATAAYYQRKKNQPGSDYELNLTLTLKNANPLLQAYVPQLYLARGKQYTGQYFGAVL